MFSIVWQIEENRKENPGDYFLSQDHKFLPPKSRGKAWRENSFTALLP